MNYQISEEQLNLLIQIFNTLNLIKTKGQDTVYMGQCLSSLKIFIDTVSNIEITNQQE